MHSKKLLTVIVLTLNEEDVLPLCLSSLSWADDKVVVDSGSTDRTCEIAVEYGARLIHRQFDNYASQRNAALCATESDWVLFVDADEIVSSELASSILSVIEDRSEVGWLIPRHNYIFGKLILHAGWFPDYQLRLFRRKLGHYSENRPVHEVLEIEGSIGKLNYPITHNNYSDVSEFIEKQVYYANYEANAMKLQNIKPRFHNYFVEPLRHFCWRFFMLSGWKSGYHGLLLSILMAYSRYVVYRQLAALYK